MEIDKVISELRAISATMRTFSMWPGLSFLALESDALDGLIANRPLIEKVYGGVEVGVGFIQTTITFFKDHNLNNAIGYLTTMVGVKTASVP